MTARPLSFKIANFYILQNKSLNSTHDLAGQMIHRTENDVYYISLHIRERSTLRKIYITYTHTPVQKTI